MLPAAMEDPRAPGAAGSAAAGTSQRDEEAALSLYQTLRAQGGARTAEVRMAAGLDETRAARGWLRLRELGLVRVTDGFAEPVDPDAALAQAMDAHHANTARQLREAEALRQVTESLTAVYRPAVAREATEVAVEYIADRRRRARFLADLNASSRRACDSMHPGPMPPIEVLEHSLELDREMIARGLRLRALYPRFVLDTPRHARYLHDLAGIGVEVRLIDHAPYDMLLMDGLVACLPANLDSPSDAMVVVRGASLLKSYVALYEDLWMRGVPFGGVPAARADGEVGPQERAIVQLMAAGLTDDQIARRMGVHRRTVQRAVSRLMERLGAASRFEAGLKLARSAEYGGPEAGGGETREALS